MANEPWGIWRAEWRSWQKVCSMLREAGAVTEADLNSPVSENNTPGQKLLNQLREWGERTIETRKAQEQGRIAE